MLMDDINSTDAMEFSIEASGVKGLKRAPFAAGARRERGAPIPASPGAASSASRAASGLSNASTHSRLAAPGTGAPRGQCANSHGLTYTRTFALNCFEDL